MKNYNRWVILVASCLINLCIGSVYSWSIFAAPMAVNLSQITGTNITAAQLAMVFTVANLSGPVTMISGGKINDILGPRIILLAGGIMFAVGLILSGFAQSVVMLILGYGIVAGLGLGFAYGCTISNSVKFFPDKKGLIGGICTASYGLSSVILPPIATVLIERFGIADTFKILGVTFGLIVCGAAFFVQKCPAGYVPAGYELQQNVENGAKAIDKDWKEMLKSPVFYVMLTILLCGAFSGMMCISQAASIAQTMIGLNTTLAATAVSVLALFNAAGRVLAGRLSDKIGRINTLSLGCAVEVAGLFLLTNCKEGSRGLFFAGIALVGIAFGAFMGVYPSFTADQFGTKNNSVNYGIMFIGFAVAGYAGPATMKNMYSQTGTYRMAFFVAIASGVVGFLLTGAYKELQKKGEP